MLAPPILFSPPALGPDSENGPFTPTMLLRLLAPPPGGDLHIISACHWNHGESPFEAILHDFTQDLQKMQQQTHGSFILGAADCNTQLKTMPGHVGPETGANDRLGDEEGADSIMHTLALLGLTAPSSYVNVGPTRSPWPQQSRVQHPSVIDYLFAGQKLNCKVHLHYLPTPDTPTDHKPIGMTALAPYASRKDRRLQFESQLAQHQFWGKRLHATWTPGNLTGLKQKLGSTQFTSLPKVSSQLLEAA